jgi:hypothetical protein
MLRHQPEVTEHFGLEKQNSPAIQRFRDMAQHVDVAYVVAIFMAWAATHPIPEGRRDCPGWQGLRSTVQDCLPVRSRILSAWSAPVFMDGRMSWVRLVLKMVKRGEIGAVRDLLQQLDVVGVGSQWMPYTAKKNG